MTDRIAARFEALKAADRAGLVTFLCAGDPDIGTFEQILARLPQAGADIIEIGMPFSDPMADGPSIQAGNLRALDKGITLARVLEITRRFREHDATTPVVLMGYYNPIHKFGRERFLDSAKAAGVDGLIIVDLPPEEDEELCLPALERGLHFIRLATPTTDARRLPRVIANSSGFLYYVSVTGITGQKRAQSEAVAEAVGRLRGHTNLPIAVGFGIREPDQAAAIARVADAAVVGSALVEIIAGHIDADGHAGPGTAKAVLARVEELAAGVRGARNA